MFVDREHYDFFIKKSVQLNADVYLKALIYAVGINDDTRQRWSSFYDEVKREIKPEVIGKAWQTSTTRRITRLAFQLFTDGTPTAFNYTVEDDREIEIQQYSVSDIFCCEYAPFFVEAIKLRYPEYFTPRRVYNETQRIIDKLEDDKKAAPH